MQCKNTHGVLTASNEFDAILFTFFISSYINQWKTAFQGSNQKVEKLPQKMVSHNHLSPFQTSFSPSFPLLFCFHGNNTSCIFNDERSSPSFSHCSLTILQEALDVYCIVDKPAHSFWYTVILNKSLISITYFLRLDFILHSCRCHCSHRFNKTHRSIYIPYSALKWPLDSWKIHIIQKQSNKERK